MKYSTHSLLLPFLLLSGIILNSCNGGSNRSAKETVTSDSLSSDTVSSVQKDSTSRKATSLRTQVKNSVQNSSVKRFSKEVVRNQKLNCVDTHKADRKSARLFADLGKRTVSKFFATPTAIRSMLGVPSLPYHVRLWKRVKFSVLLHLEKVNYQPCLRVW